MHVYTYSGLILNVFKTYLQYQSFSTTTVLL